ncbi:uncharacterized protein [Dysidea avara]|uniref:uncharacterized protein n=1 Tax=Dysidea avara TaxID=196820 RepID=UPI00331BF801
MNNQSLISYGRGGMLLLFTISLIIVVLYCIYIENDPSVLDEKQHTVIRKQQPPAKLDWLTNSNGIYCQWSSNSSTKYTEMEIQQLQILWDLMDIYKDFHRAGVEHLRNGNSRKVRTLTWHCGDDCAGLGFRFKGIIVNLFLAIFSDRVLLLKWDKVSLENTHLLPNMIDWQYHDYSLAGSSVNLGTYIIKYANVQDNYEKKWINVIAGDTMHLQMLYNRDKHLNEMLSGIFSIKSDNYVRLKKKLLTHRIRLDLAQLSSFKFLFTVGTQIQWLASDVLNKLNLQEKPYVALHLRTGGFDGNVIESKSRFANSLRKWKHATECAIQQVNNLIGPDGVVVLLSDNKEAKKMLSNEYHQVKVLDNQIVHVDKTAHLTNSSMLDTWQDVLIMAEASLVVHGHSSFPEVAFAFCGIPLSRTICYEHDKCHYCDL